MYLGCSIPFLVHASAPAPSVTVSESGNLNLELSRVGWLRVKDVIHPSLVTRARARARAYCVRVRAIRRRVETSWLRVRDD